MEIGGIRETFSKGTVLLSSDGVTVFYTFTERWVSQSVSGKSLGVFQNLIDSCDKFGIEYRTDKFIKFVFSRENDGQSVVFFQPLSEEVSIEELQAIAQETEPSEDFIEFFDGVDLDDEDEVFQKLLEWMRLNEPEKDETKRFGWQGFCDRAMKLARFCSCTCEVSEPESIELQFPEGRQRAFGIEGEEKENLGELVQACSNIGIEGYVPDGFLNITFYV